MNKKTHTPLYLPLKALLLVLAISFPALADSTQEKCGLDSAIDSSAIALNPLADDRSDPKEAALLRPDGTPHQKYEVVYRHSLHNRTGEPLRKVRVYLTVPPESAYQHISSFRVEKFETAASTSNRTDEYGNRLKRVEIVEVPAHGKATVGFSCLVTLADPPRFDLEKLRGADLDDIPEGIRERFTRDHPIFGLESKEVGSRAKKLLREHPDPADRVRAIHDLIASTFRYESSGGWDPAPGVLARKNGSCSEFTYAFCALCRATGIPTRMVGASIFSPKAKSPFRDATWHRWAEVYLPGSRWIPVDVTLDRRKPPKHTYLGSHCGRTLIVSHKGDRSTQLGLSYISSDSGGARRTRERVFVWSVGTMELVEEARKQVGTGRWRATKRKLARLIETCPNTIGALRAQELLDDQKKDD